MKVFAVLASLAAAASAYVYVKEPADGATVYAGQDNTFVVAVSHNARPFCTPTLLIFYMMFSWTI